MSSMHPRRPAAQTWLRGSHGIVALALLVGAGAGVGAVFFRYLILWFTLLFTGHHDSSGARQHAYGFFHGGHLRARCCAGMRTAEVVELDVASGRAPAEIDGPVGRAFRDPTVTRA